MRSSWKSCFQILPPILLACSLFGLYLYTMAPGLTWANSGNDGGDLITAAYTGGIAHPTGYPLYLLLARLFQFLPIGSLAYRTNLMSAFFTALAAALVFRIVVRSIPSEKGNLAWPAGLLAGYAFGLAPVVWSQAVITEVYALQSFLVLAALSLHIDSAQETGTGLKRLDRLRGLVLGLATSNHITAILILPAVLCLGSFRRGITEAPGARWGKFKFGNFAFARESFFRLIGWFGLGCSLYLLLPLRALSQPPVNWGNPLDLQRFWWLVSGSLYQDYYLGASAGLFWEGIQSVASLFLQQFGLFGLALGLTGLVVFWVPSRLNYLSLWITFVSLGFTLQYTAQDSFLYLIPVFSCFAIWMGLGIYGLLEPVTRLFPRAAIMLAIFFCIYMVGHNLRSLQQVDAAHDLRAEAFGMEVLSVAPDKALIFTEGDRALFSLWYFHFALEQRPDLIVISPELLHFDWYQDNLNSTYPALSLPGPLPWPGTVAAANPSRPVCYAHYTDRTVIDCSR